MSSILAQFALLTLYLEASWGYIVINLSMLCDNKIAFDK